jgi:DNA-binding NarL/FixJ family response regulator
MASERVLRVVVADDSAGYRAALAHYLATLPHIELVGEVADGEEALRLVQALAPDLLILDLHMPKLSGIAVLERMQAQQLPTAVLVLSAQPEAYYQQMLPELGAAAYVPKGEIAALATALERLTTALR